MKKFLVLYYMPEGAMESMKDMTPEDMKKGMEVWMKWKEDNEANIVDFGAPVGLTQKVTPSGSERSPNGLGGYSIIQAEDLDAATKLMENHPHNTWAEGCWIDVTECKEMKME